MDDVIPYIPYSAKALYDYMLEQKRDLVAVGLPWTAESPTDPGIAILKINSELGGLLAQYMASRVSQNYLIYAKDREAVHAGCRQLGYKLRGAIASKIRLTITASGAQTIPAGAVVEKTLSDGSKIQFELLDDVVFTAPGSRFVYALQGKTSAKIVTGTNQAYQTVVIPDYPLAFGSMVVSVGSVAWTEVADFVMSGPESRHFVVETDYVGQATIIFGDGKFGKKPGNGAQIAVAWRTCDGAKGNVSAGAMQFVNNYARITSVANTAPNTAVIASTVHVTSTEITVEDPNSLVAFADSGVAYIGEDSFTYTSIAGNQFLGVTGLEYSHATGEEITYSVTYTYGMDRETSKQGKLSALRHNRIKSSAGSLLDYDYLVSRISGVARTKAMVTGNVITIQVVPADGGLPSSFLKNAIVSYLAPRKSALHTVNIINPKYVFVDVRAEVAPGSGYNFTKDVKPEVLSTIQEYLDPLKKDDSSMYFLNGWGNLLKKNLLEANIFELWNRALVADVEIVQFKRSTDATGNANIQLAPDEIAQIGKISIVLKGVTVPLFGGELEGPEGVGGVGKMAKLVV